MQRESELIDKAKAGSVSAFTLLVEGYRERLLRFLLTRCPSYADAEDALQDTLINAYRYLYSYDPRWRFSTWLYRIATNESLTFLDRRRRRQVDPDPIAGPELPFHRARRRRRRSSVDCSPRTHPNRFVAGARS